MLTNGFRLYRGEDGLLLDQIVDGMVYGLEPLPDDQARQLGYYDAEFNLVEPEQKSAGWLDALLKYSEDEPRDDHGRWDGGGGLAASETISVQASFRGGQIDVHVNPSVGNMAQLVRGGGARVLVLGNGNIAAGKLDDVTHNDILKALQREQHPALQGAPENVGKQIDAASHWQVTPTPGGPHSVGRFKVDVTDSHSGVSIPASQFPQGLRNAMGPQRKSIDWTLLTALLTKSQEAPAMEIETFFAPFEFKFVEESTGAAPGTFTGYGSIFDVEDHHKDLIRPGAFRESLKSASMPSMFVEHSGFLPGGDPLPVGVWTEVTEDERGLSVKGKLSALDSDHTKRILGLMRDGALPGLSIAYQVPEGGATFPKAAGGPRRIISRIKLHSIDIVRDPSNSGSRITEIKSAVDELKALLAHADHAGATAAVQAAIKLHRASTAGGDSPTASERSQLHDHLQTAHTCLTGAAMKAKPDTIREFEDLLWSAGYSRSESKRISTLGFKSADPRDEEAAAAAATAARGEAVRGIAATLGGFSLPSFGD
jgi:Escherichia/Staphylococcus phage prohead protease